jgi:hypothetical protein
MTRNPNTTRQQRYRAKHRRFDYTPGEDVLEIIERHRKLMPWSTAGVIDALIMAGDNAFTVNDSK